MGPLIPLYWTFGDISSGFQSHGGQPYSPLAEVYVLHVHGVTPANLLAVSMAAEPLPHTCKALVVLETGGYHATAHSVRSGRPDALPTELSQLGFK